MVGSFTRDHLKCMVSKLSILSRYLYKPYVDNPLFDNLTDAVFAEETEAPNTENIPAGMLVFVHVI